MSVVPFQKKFKACMYQFYKLLGLHVIQDPESNLDKMWGGSKICFIGMKLAGMYT